MWVVSSAEEADRFDAFFDQALREIAAARAAVRAAVPDGTAPARVTDAGVLLGLTLELSALLLLLRAAREGDLPLFTALKEAERIALRPLPSVGLPPALVRPAARMEALRTRLAPLLPQAQGHLTQGHEEKREKPLRRPIGRPRLRLVVTNP